MPYNHHRSRPSQLSIKGEHIGVVVDNKDPEKLERVKYRIAGLHDQLSDDDLPWVLPHRGGMANSASGAGSVGPIPPVGTAQYLKFESEDLYNGRATGVSTTKNQKNKELTSGNDTTGKDYGKVMGHIDQAGNRLTMNFDKNTFDYEHASGLHIAVDGKGHLAIKTADKAQGKNAQEKHSAGLTLHIKGDISLLGDNVTIGGKTVKIISENDLHAAGGNVHLSVKRNLIMPTPVTGNGNVPNVPNVNAPPTRSVPSTSAPADPTK